MVTRLIFKAHTMAQVDSVSVITTPLWLQPFYSPTHSLFGQKKITSHVNTTAICPFFQLKFATTHSNTIYLVPISVSVLSLSFSLFFFSFRCLTVESGTLISSVRTIIDQFTIDCFSVFDLINRAKKDLNRLLSLFYLLIENIHNNSITSNNLTQPFFVCLSL